MSNTLKSDLLLLLVTLLAAGGWIFTREALALMPPLLFMATRFLIAGVFLAWFARHELRALSTEGILRAAKVGAVFGVAMCLWINGLALSRHVGEAAFVTSLGIVVVPITAHWLFKEIIPLQTWFALPIAISGLAFLSVSQSFTLELSQVLLLVSALIYAVYFNLNTRAANVQSDAPKVPVLALTTLVTLVSSAITGLASAALEPWEINPLSMSSELWLWLLLSALVATALRFVVQTWAQSLTNSSNGAIILILEPLWTAVLAAAWFGESMAGTQLIGCALIFLSLLVNRLRAIKMALSRR